MDKMREEFEAWYENEPDRTTATKCAMWKSWKASRAALRVELPQDMSGEYYADGWNACLIATADKLEAQGVSSK